MVPPHSCSSLMHTSSCTPSHIHTITRVLSHLNLFLMHTITHTHHHMQTIALKTSSSCTLTPSHIHTITCTLSHAHHHMTCTPSHLHTITCKLSHAHHHTCTPSHMHPSQAIKAMRLEIAAQNEIIAIMDEGLQEHEKHHDACPTDKKPV